MSATSASGNCPERRVTGNGDRRLVSRHGRARGDNRSGDGLATGSRHTTNQTTAILAQAHQERMTCPMTRIEEDTLRKDAGARPMRYCGAQTQRSLQDFKIGDERMPDPLFRALGIQKKAAACPPILRTQRLINSSAAPLSTQLRK